MQGDTYIANPCAVYTGLDLRKGLITFGGHKIFAAEDYSFLHKPRIVGDRSKAFSIREALDLRDSISFDMAPGIESVVLPSVPECFLGFVHEGLPFATTLTENMETALALEKYKLAGKRQFWFSFYQAPTEYIMEKMVPNYEKPASVLRLALISVFCTSPHCRRRCTVTFAMTSMPLAGTARSP